VKVGVSGPEEGMTRAQETVAPQVLTALGATVLHIGDCVGVDAQFHGIGRTLGLWLVGHPPDNPAKRAFCDYDEIRKPLPYLKRNDGIVAESEILVATPQHVTEIRRGSGTWATIRRSWAKHPQTVLIHGLGHICIGEGRGLMRQVTLKELQFQFRR
jgi:hypothetical protein